MSKYSYEQKLEAVLNVLEKHFSLRESAKCLGISREQVRNWVNRYERFGPEGLVMKNGSYDGEFKQSVVEYMHNSNLSINETAVMFGIPAASTVEDWEHIYYEEGPQALYKNNRGRKKDMSLKKPRKKELPKEAEESLTEEVERLRMEVAYLKKLNALIQEREKSKKKTK